MIIKSYNGLYEEMFSPYNIKLAIINAGKNKTKNNKRHRELRFLKEHCDSEEVINQVRMNMVYFVPPKHRSIEINDGISAKKRNIIVPTVQEVIVHHAVLNVLKPILAKGFYEHSYASIPNRGTHRAVKVIKKWIKNDHAGTKYCLKLDVRKFFESIDQEVLIRKLDKIIRDRQFMDILIKIIRTTDKGIPLGFTTSQWFANYILTELDHKIKENFGVKYYIRFMDDMVIFGSNKKRLHQIKNQIEEYLNKELHLELKNNWQVFFMDSVRSRKKKGKLLDFLGFKFYRTHTGIRRKVALRAQRKAKRIFKKRQGNKKVNIHEARQMVVYAGLCKYANCHDWFHTHVLKYVSIRKLRKQISVYDKLNAKRRCQLMNWYYAEGKDRPLVTDETSSKKWVYVRRNIEEFEREDEADPTIKEKFYKWEEIKIRKEDYPIYQLEVQNAANLDYLAMMNDIDLDSDEDEDEGE